MVDTKTKIAIVAGLIYDVELFSVFETLQDEFEITVFALDDADLLTRFRSSIPIKVFTEIEDMPGYMRALEANLGETDLIICLESSRLSSFQGLRAGLKNNIPVICMVTETAAHKYAGYSNILAIQEDIYRNASLLVAFSEAASQRLLLEGVSSDKIKSLRLGSTLEDFSYCESRRAKFRQYIKVSDSALVVTFRGDLTQGARPEQQLQALKLLEGWDAKLAARIRMIFAGNGAMADELRYMACDLGVGKQVMFLHQDIEPFARDLYSASDFMVSLESEDPGLVSVFPRWILDSMLCRSIPVVFPGSDATLLMNNNARLVEPDADSLFTLYKSILSHPLSLIDEGKRAEQYVRNNFDNELLSQDWRQTLRGVLSACVQSTVPSFDEVACGIEGALKEKRFGDALAEVDKLLQNRPPATPPLKARAQRFRGDALSGLNQLSPAMEAYRESVESDPKNYESYLGLGHIAFRSQSYQEAFTFFKKAISFEPNSPEACLGIGLVHRSLAMLEESSYWLLRCLKLENENSRALMVLTQVVQDFDDGNFAIDCLERGRETVGEEPSLMLALGRLYIREGQSELGQSMIAKAGILLK